MARGGRRKRNRAFRSSLPSLPFSGEEVGVLLRALSLFEHALRHDQRERQVIASLKRKLHESLASKG